MAAPASSSDAVVLCRNVGADGVRKLHRGEWFGSCVRGTDAETLAQVQALRFRLAGTGRKVEDGRLFWLLLPLVLLLRFPA